MVSNSPRRNGPPGDTCSSTNRRSTRRQFLRATGAPVLGLASAGCLSSLPPLGGDVAFGRVDVPPADPPTYREWLPAPSALRGPDDEDGGYDPMYASPSRVAEAAPDGFPPIFQHVLLAATDWFGADVATYDRVVSTESTVAIESHLQATTVADALASGGYERAERYEGYEVFARPDDDRRAAVRDGAIVWSRNEASANDVRAVIDARAGRADRYHEVDEAFETFSTRVGTSPQIAYGFSWAAPRSNEPRATASSTRFGDGAVFHVQDMLYPSDSGVPVDEIKRHLRETRRPREASSVDVQADGRFASVQLRFPNDRLTPGGITDYPQATWSHEYDSAAGTVTVRHEAGQTVPADHLELRGTGRGDEANSWRDAYDVVGPGASITVDLDDPPSSIDLTYEPNDNSSISLYTIDLE